MWKFVVSAALLALCAFLVIRGTMPAHRPMEPDGPVGPAVQPPQPQPIVGQHLEHAGLSGEPKEEDPETPKPQLRSRLRGRVVGPDGEPVIGASLMVVPSGESEVMKTDIIVESQTDDNGDFDVSLMTGVVVDVILRSAQYRKGGRSEISVDAVDLNLGLIRLDAGVPLMGTVVDGSGNLISGVFVYALPSDSGGSYDWGKPALAESVPGLDLPVALSTRTDVNGNFEIRSAIEGVQYDLSARYSPFWKEGTSIAITAPQEGIQLALTGAARILVRISGSVVPEQWRFTLDTWRDSSCRTSSEICSGPTASRWVPPGDYAVCLRLPGDGTALLNVPRFSMIPGGERIIEWNISALQQGASRSLVFDLPLATEIRSWIAHFKPVGRGANDGGHFRNVTIDNEKRDGRIWNPPIGNYEVALYGSRRLDQVVLEGTVHYAGVRLEQHLPTRVAVTGDLRITSESGDPRALITVLCGTLEVPFFVDSGLDSMDFAKQGTWLIRKSPVRIRGLLCGDYTVVVKDLRAKVEHTETLTIQSDAATVLQLK